MRSSDAFVRRHIGPNDSEQLTMLREVGFDSLSQLTDAIVPKSIRSQRLPDLPDGCDEHQALAELRQIANKNQVFRSYIGMGYFGCKVPPVIQRNILENPGWYTQYTPYQAEIAQGRLEALINFQTMIAELTGLPVANASLLDEATAAAEAMTLSFNARAKTSTATKFFVASDVNPNTIAVVRTRGEPFGISIVVEDQEHFTPSSEFFGALLQYPGTFGTIRDARPLIQRCHDHNVLVTMATDLLALTLIKTPGELGADIAIGNSQRFGVPLGYGGPHAAFFATKDEHVRKIPGRIVGVSKDRSGNPALRLALQTREQHIRRDKATSNICTSQVLLAIMASMYAVYHGPKGLKSIAESVSKLAAALGKALVDAGYSTVGSHYFDTVTIKVSDAQVADIRHRAEKQGVNLRYSPGGLVSIACDETMAPQDVFEVFSAITNQKWTATWSDVATIDRVPAELRRESEYLRQPVFNSSHSETLMMRYIRRLERRDLSLTQSMIPLGSCTMKLNAAAELMPVSWPEFGNIHPFAPPSQAEGYRELTSQLERMLAQLTGFDAVSLQPNSGAQGEYAGLLAIRFYHQARGQAHRDVCLIPQSAHGTNPASAVMAGMRVVPVLCDEQGNIDVADLNRKAEAHASDLSALMVTYPSTHGVFEEEIREICAIVHRHGGQVYMDGANFNAQVGICYPGEYGPDVCHLNLHKTFAIPHGGGGPGMGPIAVKSHLASFLPSSPLADAGQSGACGPVSAANWGSASILVIPWMYIRMMGGEGLRQATEVAMLNANYIAKRLHPYFPVLYRGINSLVAHECIVDMRPLKKRGIEVEDVAKRLIDYGYHAPTIAWPVPGTMMIEPTESESLSELDMFCDAMIGIYQEAMALEDHVGNAGQSPLKNAPHTAEMVTADRWPFTYARTMAAYPLEWVRESKFWPFVGRIDNAYGDRNLVCACPPFADYDSN